MSPEYLAGFFDGEGCIDVQISYPAAGQSRFYCRPRIRIAQAQSGRVVIDCPHQRFGGTLLERKAGNDRQQPSISWELLGKEGMVPMLELLIPYLILKREQAKTFSMTANTASCAGLQPKNSSIMAPHQIWPMGLAMFLPAMSGADPCTGSNKEGWVLS